MHGPKNKKKKSKQILRVAKFVSRGLFQGISPPFGWNDDKYQDYIGTQYLTARWRNSFINSIWLYVSARSKIR